jgi:VWFA-related protein
MGFRPTRFVLGCVAFFVLLTIADAQRGGVALPGGGGVAGAGAGRGARPPDDDERSRPQQDDAPTFRSRVTVVQVDAIVTDDAGNPVTGLTQKDFEVSEAGHARKITTFSAVDIPLPTEATTGLGLESDMVTNGTPPGRTYLIALDEVDPKNAIRARHFLRDFIEKQFGPNDVAAVSLTGRGLASSAQDFTSNKRLILEAIDKFSGTFVDFGNMLEAGLTECTNLCGTSPDGGGAKKSPITTSDPRQLGSSLRRLTEFLGRLPGRKVLLYVGEGLGGLDPYQATTYRGTSLTPGELDFHEAIAAATRGNVTIYPIDPRGLTSEIYFDPALVLIELNARSDLAGIADVTGGFSLVQSNNFADATSRMVRENSQYYTLGFESEYEKRDGRFVPVDVRVTRPGLHVRARQGYVAPLGREAASPTVSADAKMPTVTSALGSAVAVNDVTMRAVATPYRGKGDRAIVALAIEFDISKLDLIETNGVLTGDLEVSFVATDTRGKVRPGRRYDTTLSLKKEAAEAAFRSGVRVLSRIELPKGRYQLRIAAGGRTRAGSVMYDLEVPDFSDGLRMSGVSLTSSTATTLSTFRAADAIGSILPASPVATRDFSRQETVAIYAEAYDAGGGTALPTMSAELRTATGTVIGRLLQPKPSPALQGGTGAIGFSATLPLGGVPPGVYVIHVEAAAANRTDVVHRDVPIRVW